MLDNFTNNGNGALIHVKPKEVRGELTEKEAEKSSAIDVDHNWSPSVTVAINTSPKVWTRGLLYLLIALIAVVVPWAVFAKIDETGTARGKVEPKDDSVKLDSTIAGTVSQILVREGDKVEAGQVLLTVGSELVESELKQAQDKLAGQINRLNQLNLLKGQLTLTLSTQQQQNKAAELEKQSQIDQARRNLEAIKNSYNLLESEKQAQVGKALQNANTLKVTFSPNQAEKKAQVDQARAVYLNQQNSLKNNSIALVNAKKELDRYTKALEQGIVADIQVSDKVERVHEKQRIYEQNISDIEQARLHLNELINNYNKAMVQAHSEIQQTKLNLTEQTSNYSKTTEQAKSDIEQAELRSQQQEQGLQSLIHNNELALLKIKEQLKSNDTDMGLLQAEIAQTKSQIESLRFQLSQRTVKSPINGVIYHSLIKNAGSVVQLGAPIVEIASPKSKLVLRALMPTSESGYVKKGLTAKLKFDAYPFQDYGIVAGEILSVSPTTSVKETANGKVEGYQIEVGINQTCLEKNNQCIPLHPGDTATAEIIVRQRRIIDFVLDPFKKIQKGGLRL